MMEYNFFSYDSPIGKIRISYTDNAIIGLDFLKMPNFNSNNNSEILKKCINQLDDYFKGKTKEFSINIEFLNGTEFQKKVWKSLLSVKYGEVASYKDIATINGNYKASRAIGGANNKNPISIIIPCHRIIGSNGKLVGYGGGIEKKIWLLNHERKHYE